LTLKGGIVSTSSCTRNAAMVGFLWLQKQQHSPVE
jgi:hypothetical protein